MRALRRECVEGSRSVLCTVGKMIRARNAGADKAKEEGVRRVRDMLLGLLPDDEKEEADGGTAEEGSETSIIVNQLACKEPGCPDVEVVITLLRAKPRPKLMFKIYKAAADLKLDEVESALRKALVDEQAELTAAEKKQEEHDHEHSEAKDHGHAHGDDCCDCGHEHGHESHSSEHGHAEDETKKQKTNEHSHT